MIDDLIGGAVDVAASASESTSTRGCLAGLALNLLGMMLILGGAALVIWGRVDESLLILAGGCLTIAAGIGAFIWSFVERNR